MGARDNQLHSWCETAARRVWQGARITAREALRGDLSTRRFWRIRFDGAGSPSSAILIDLGPDDLPGYARTLNLVAQPLAEPPWIIVHRFLASLGMPVPAIYGFDATLRALLVEDVGELSLVDAIRATPSQTADLFRLAVELLLAFHVDGTAALPKDLLPAKIAYDARLFRWEFKEFLDLGCAALGFNVDATRLVPELDALANELGRFPRLFSHRDFHRENLFVQNQSGKPRLRVIDFQDALMAPAAHDLAVLLTTRDTDTVVSPELEQRLLDFYYAGLVRRNAAQLGSPEFLRSYRLCVLQHAIKMMGRFLNFERNGKSGYARFVPHTIEQARRMLALFGKDFPELTRAFAASGGTAQAS